MAYFKLNSGCFQLDSWIISLYWTRIEAGPSSGVQNSTCHPESPGMAYKDCSGTKSKKV